MYVVHRAKFKKINLILFDLMYKYLLGLSEATAIHSRFL